MGKSPLVSNYGKGGDGLQHADIRKLAKACIHGLVPVRDFPLFAGA